MTHRDIYTKFMIEYDKANVTSSYPSLTPYEVATILDKAYLALIARKVTGNNPRRSQLESDIKAVSDLAPLITTENCSLRLVGRNIASYILPEKFLYYVSSTMDYNNTTEPQDSINSRLLPITLTTHNVAEKFLATLYNMPWVKNPVCYLEDDTMYVVYDPINKPAVSSSAHLTYIKAPAKFAGASDFDPSNAPIYEPDPVVEPDDDEPIYNPGGNNNQGETDAPGGNGQQGGQLQTTDYYTILIGSARRDETYGINVYLVDCVVYKNGNLYNDGVVSWKFSDSSLESKIQMDESLDGRTCYLNVTRELSSYNVQVQASINGISKSKTVYLGYHTTTIDEGQTVTPTPGQDTASNSSSSSTIYTNYDYTKLPPDALSIDIDFTKPETLNFSPALTKSGDMWRSTQVSDSGYVQHAGPNNLVSITYRDKRGEAGDGVQLMYTLQSGYYLWLKYWSAFVVTLNDSHYELYRIIFYGNTSVFNNANSVEKTWYANSPGIRENMLEVGYSTAEMTKMKIIYRPTSNNDNYKWQYVSYSTTWNGTVCPLFRKNYLSCGGTNFRLVDGTQYASIDTMGTIKIKNTPPYEYEFKVYCECEQDPSVNQTISIPSYEITHASGGDPDPNIVPVEEPKEEFNLTISYDPDKSTENTAVIHLVMSNPDNLTSVRTKLQFKKIEAAAVKGWIWSDLTSNFFFGKTNEDDYELNKSVNLGIRYNNELVVRAYTAANGLPASVHESNEITIPTTS